MLPILETSFILMSKLFDTMLIEFAFKGSNGQGR